MWFAKLYTEANFDLNLLRSTKRGINTKKKNKIKSGIRRRTKKKKSEKKKKEGIWSNYVRLSATFSPFSSLGCILSSWLGRDYLWRCERRIQYWLQRAADLIAFVEQWTKTIGKDRDRCDKTIFEIRTCRK